MKMSDEELRDIFRGVKFTFSQHCRSGIVGRGKCICRRCLKERGEPTTEEADRLAAIRAGEIDARKKLGAK